MGGLRYQRRNVEEVHEEARLGMARAHNIRMSEPRTVLYALYSRMCYALQATVLLNANVAFLAVPGVINNAGMTMASTGSSGYAQTAAQIASYVSIVLSIGAIILGLLLVRQNRTQEHEDVDSAVRWICESSYRIISSITYRCHSCHE